MRFFLAHNLHLNTLKAAEAFLNVCGCNHTVTKALRLVGGDECGRRDLNPGRQLGKLMSYQTGLRPRYALSISMGMFAFSRSFGDW